MSQQSLSVEELASKGSPACQEAFAFLREQLKSDPNVEEAVECGPLKEMEAPTCYVKETPRIRVFFGENWKSSCSYLRGQWPALG